MHPPSDYIDYKPGSETVCANLGICILSHLLEHSLYTVLHLKHLNFVLYIESPKFTGGSRGREQTARPSGGVIELRREEGGRPYIKVATRGGRPPQPESNQRRKTGSQAVFRTDEYLTPGWIQPPDKPVSGFDRLPPFLYKPFTFLSVEDDVAALPW